MKQLSIVSACLVAFLVALPAVAQDDGGAASEQRHSGPFPMDLSAYGMLSIPAGYDLGVGAGVHFAYPIVAQGWIKNPRYPDAFYIEGGLDFSWYHWDYSYPGYTGYNADILSFRPVAGVRYQVYFSDRWAAFGCVKGGLAFSSIHWDEDPGNSDNLEVDFVLGFAPGLLWDINDSMSLRGELSFGAYEYFGVRFGLLFRL